MSGSARRWCWSITCALALLALPPTTVCERLPIRVYGSADGLPSSDVNVIKRDSRGFLWFATNEGLARFDGYEFETYGQANGLPRNAVSDFLETRSGVYLAATSDGLAKFQPNARAGEKFTIFRPASADARRIYVLYEDRSGQIWCGTEGGLFRLRRQSKTGPEWQFETVPLAVEPGKPPTDQRVISLFEDSRGNLWIGTFHALYRRTRDSRISEYICKPREGIDFLWNVVLEDHAGRLWAGTGCGLWRILPYHSGKYKFVPVFVPKQRVIVWSMLEDQEGKLWLGTSSGLIEWTAPKTDNQQPRIYTETNGLSHNSLTTLCTDREGNLWFGSEGGGAMRLARSGFVTYGAEDHLGFKRFTGVNATLFRDRDGNVFPAFHHIIDVLRGNKFREITPAIPRPHGSYLGWGWHQTVVQDRAGEWWIATGEGLVRFPSVTVDALGRTPPKAVYTIRDGLRTNDIFRVFEDRSGGIWIACIGPAGVNGLSRWDRRTGSLHNFTEHSVTVATAFAEDHDGTIWIGYYDGTLGRFRAGAFQFYGTEDGLTGGGIQALHTDRVRRLWIASLGGVVRVDEPLHHRPHFTRFGTKDGLSSNIALCIAEDRWGRIYIATGHGLDRIGATGRIAPALVRHYTQSDGLAKGDLRDVLFDGGGVLWCASKQGISRLLPEPEDSRRPPSPVFIRRVRVRGVPLENFDGAGSILKLASNQNQLQIDFAGLAFAPGDALRYQYKLQPADGDWSNPSAERTVNYSNLAPGTYQFNVRLVRDGLLEGDPAMLRFAIQAPVWQRWWFRLLIALSAAGVVYRLHRYRISRLLELERIRTRIATDLHDDIGSTLSQIAVLTEVAQIRVGEDKPDLKETLSRIGSVSRDLSESMSDIVWSVNPQRDRLSDLVQRIRRFSSDLFSRGNIDFRFRSSVPEQAVYLAADLRREVYLIFKEAVNNVIRHSNCTRAELAISIDNGCLELLVEDNGRGFCERGNDMGNGLSSMRARAQRMGAGLEVGSGRDGGVRVVLQVPMRSGFRPQQPT